MLCAQGHDVALRYGEVLEDGRRLVTASGDRQITVWDMEAGTPIITLQRAVGSRVKSVAATRDGTLAVVVRLLRSVYSVPEGFALLVWKCSTHNVARPRMGSRAIVIFVFSDPLIH